MAEKIRSERGIPIKETIESVVKAVRGAVVAYEKETKCPLCDSKRTIVTSTRKPIRLHKCQFCGNAFRSLEEIPEEIQLETPIQDTAKPEKPIVKRKKKPHIKSKGR